MFTTQENDIVVTSSMLRIGIFPHPVKKNLLGEQKSVPIMGHVDDGSEGEKIYLISKENKEKLYKHNFWDPKMSMTLNEAIDEYNKTAMPYHRIALYQRKKLTVEDIEKIVGKKVVVIYNNYYLQDEIGEKEDLKEIKELLDLKKGDKFCSHTPLQRGTIGMLLNDCDVPHFQK